jgi:valyl-tRNA synthetase
VLFHVLEGSLRLLHPFMPFVTEEAWQYLTDDGRWTTDDGRQVQSIMLAVYPQANTSTISDDAERDWALVQDLIVAIRNIRNEYKVEPARFIAATVAAGERVGLLEAQRAQISRLARVADDQLMIAERMAVKPEQAAALVIRDVEIFLPLAGLVDLDAERERLQKELQAAEAEVDRRGAKLNNASFVERAPAAVVQRERDGLAAAQATVERLRARLEQLA